MRTTMAVSLVAATMLAALAGDWNAFPGGRWRALPEAGPAGQGGFTLLTAKDTDIYFTNRLDLERYTTNQILLNCSGVAAGDMDGDGLSDLFFAGLSGGSVLYKNLGGWKFQDVTDSAGVRCPDLDATGVVFADVDGDGDLDLIVNSIGGGTHVFVNDGRGHFKRSQVLNANRGGMSSALGDADGDGSLELYVTNYRQTTLRDHPRTNFRINLVNGQPVVAKVDGQPTTSPELAGRFSYTASGGIAEHGESDMLYKGAKNGVFSPVSWIGGVFLDEAGKPLGGELHDWGLSAMFRDLNEDGLPDIYVCNDFDSVDRIWLNLGGGVFRALPSLALRNTSKFSMGVDVADINRDGHDDLLVLDMRSASHATRMTRMDKGMEGTPLGVWDNRPQFTRNTLQLGRGDGTFAEVAQYYGLEASGWSWTPVFLDVDLDGYEDLLVTTGHGRDDMDLDSGTRIEAAKRAAKLTILEELELRKMTPSHRLPKQLFRNLGGLRFEEVGNRWGFADVGVAQGMCLADLDNDGDMDVVVNNLNGPAGIYRNQAGAARIAVRLKGLAPNTQGIGAKIRVLDGAVPLQSQEMICGGRYLSGDEAIRVFAAGSRTNRMRIEVAWRSGKRSLVEGVEGNRLYELAEDGATLPPVLPTVQAASLFADVSELIGHTHHEEGFDDFERQPLLPHRLSQLGPGVAWLDLDGDGWEDVVVGSGRGGSLAARLNDGRGGFRVGEAAPVLPLLTRSLSGLVGWRRRDGTMTVLAGSANYEDGGTEGSCVRQYDVAAKQVEDPLPGSRSSSGPLAVGPLNGVGSLALFVGGRAVGGLYPEAPVSQLFTHQAGRWFPDGTNNAVLRSAGLVSGAVWADLDGDGWPELVLACEWGPVKVFQNRQGQLRETTQEWGLAGYQGWWNGVVAGDFDGDGRLDLAVSNWGLNSQYRASGEFPRRLYYGNMTGQGQVELVESSFDRELAKWVPERDRDTLAKVFPWVREQFPLHRDYAQAGVPEILGGHLPAAAILEANWLATTVFLNRGNHFELGKLPPEAQFSPAFGINVADFDGDGCEDIFLGQNYFGVPPTTSRNDAGRGLLLRGDGKGSFVAQAGPASGLLVYGEQRGSAVGDYDHDGRPDLLVSQNGAPTKLYHNVGGKSGLRVSLKGPPENPDGIGAVLRLGFGSGRWGPAREIQAGSGYWSQDSVGQILAAPSTPSQIQVRWPGSPAAVFTELAPGVREVRLDVRGRILLSR